MIFLGLRSKYTGTDSSKSTTYMQDYPNWDSKLSELDSSAKILLKSYREKLETHVRDTAHCKIFTEQVNPSVLDISELSQCMQDCKKSESEFKKYRTSVFPQLEEFQSTSDNIRKCMNLGRYFELYTQFNYIRPTKTSWGDRPKYSLPIDLKPDRFKRYQPYLEHKLGKRINFRESYSRSSYDGSIYELSIVSSPDKPLDVVYYSSEY